MSPRWLRLPAAALLLCLAAAAAAAATPSPPRAAPPPPAARPTYIGGVPDTGQFLPDTTTLIRVGGRVTRVRDFVELYFASDPQFRPPPDSLGRLEFLNSLINREVMALTARDVGRPLTFEDRAALREHRERILSDIAFRRLVADSVRIREADLQRIYEQYKYEQRMRLIRFADHATATRVRAELVAKRLAWAEAVRRHHRPLAGEPADGEVGWLPRAAFDPGTGLVLYGLKPGEISEVLTADEGYRVYQAVERRKVDAPAYVGVRRLIYMHLRNHLAAGHAARVQAEVSRDLGIRHDSTNIAWAAPRFTSRPLMESGQGGQVILNLDREVPTFTPEESARVLARHRDGEFTLGDFVQAYSAVSGPMRPVVSDARSFQEYVDLMILQPYMARLAEARGFDRDSLAMALMASREEQLRVEHLYSDSISSRVWNDPQERRAFYRENLQQLVTYPSVRFAAIVRFSQGAADSLAARLRAGERAADILRADSLSGLLSGSIQERRQNEQGPHHTLLFQELRPGDLRVIGPDESGHWLVLQSLAFDPGRQLSYEEAEHMVDDALRERKSEAMLLALVARHKARYGVEAHPERLMRVRLTDPTTLELEPNTP